MFNYFFPMLDFDARFYLSGQNVAFLLKTVLSIIYLCEIVMETHCHRQI